MMLGAWQIVPGKNARILQRSAGRICSYPAFDQHRDSEIVAFAIMGPEYRRIVRQQVSYKCEFEFISCK